MKSFFLIIVLLAGVCCAYSQHADTVTDYSYDDTAINQDPPVMGTLPPPPETGDNDLSSAEEEDDYNDYVYQPVTLPVETKDRNISGKQWQKMVNDPAFNYAPQKIAKPNSWWTDFWMRFFMFFTSGIGTILIWIIVLALVLFIIYWVIKSRGHVLFSKKNKKLSATDVDELSDEFMPDDWDAIIQNAIQSGNLRLAVRHTYRYLLILLSEKNLIKFQSAKTNYQYAGELAGSQWYQPFMQMTRQYEYAWYGGFDLKQPQFDHYYALLKDFKNRLNY